MSQQPAQPAPDHQQPADAAHTGTPPYGSFGQPGAGAHPAAHQPQPPHQQRGHVEQHQATEAVRAAQGPASAATRAAFCENDPRNVAGRGLRPAAALAGPAARFQDY